MDIHIYELNRCGFYDSNDTSEKFGRVHDWWGEFQQWVNNKQEIGLTNTYNDPKDLPSRVFCWGTVNDSQGNLGVILWNEAPNYLRDVAYVDAMGEPGHDTARTTDLPPNVIPGWPTYVWFMPSRDFVISLSPDHYGAIRSSGMRQATKYFRHYLKLCSGYRHVHHISTSGGGTEEKIVGYSDYGVSTPDNTVVPRVDATPASGNGPLDEIRRRRREINKIVKNYSLNRIIPSQNSLFNRITNRIVENMSGEQSSGGIPETDSRRVRIEYSYTPTQEELEAEIRNWEIQNLADNSSAEDAFAGTYSVGVYFSGDSQIRRFDKPIQKYKVAERTDDGRRAPQLNQHELLRTWERALESIEPGLDELGSSE